jgi:hypothetical protein
MIGYLGDLNLLGAMVISDEPFDVNTKLMISIELPELPKTTESSITLAVRVAWCHQDISPDYHNVGLEFSAITQKQSDIVQSVIDNYEFRRQSPNYPTHPNEMDDL